MTRPLFHLRRSLIRNRNLAVRAAVVDSAVSGIVTFFIATAVLIGLRQPVAIAVVPAIAVGCIVWRRPASMAEIATDLDRRHGLADLLGSAWALRDSDEPWAASLRSIAEAKAAALPPSPWPGRWTVRGSACGLAMAAAVLLAANLIPNPSTAAEPAVRYDVRASARPDERLEYATERQRAADTATSESRLPSQHESAANGQTGSETAQSAGKDANGDGHADSKQASSIELKSSAQGVADQGGTAGGHHIANGSSGKPNSVGVVQSRSGDPMDKAIESEKTPAGPSAGVRPLAPPPAGYRDLIADFFTR